MEPKKLTRSMNDRKVAGVCGGLGEYLNVDPLIFRIIFLFLLLCGGSGLILYIIMWILMPEKKNAEPIEAEYEEVKQRDVIEEVAEKIEEAAEVIEETANNINHSLNNNFMKKNRGIFWGLLLVAIGVLWLGRTFGLFHFSWYNFWRLWPMLIIWWGVSLLPIERIWKNVCSIVILAITLVLLFVLPAKSCQYNWEDQYVIKKKGAKKEWKIDKVKKDDCEIEAEEETIVVSVDSGIITINHKTIEDGETKVTVKKIEL